MPEVKEAAKRMPLVNLEAIKALAAEWCKDKILPRVSGLNDSPKNYDGTPVPVDHLIILPKFSEDLEAMLVCWIQRQFERAAYHMSESYDPNSGGVIEDRFRVVPPFDGILRLDTLNTNRRIA